MSNKVSLIMPCYNAENYIDVMMASIYGQIYDDIELICVDDGSTDSTYVRLQKWRHLIEDRGYTMSIISKKNGGTVSAINAGLNIMTGDYLCFPDADDMLMPKYVSEMCKYLNENSDMNWVRCDGLSNDYSDDRFPITLSEMNQDVLPENSLYALEHFLTQRVCITAWSIMVKSNYFKQCFPNFQLQESHMALQEYQINLPLALGSAPGYIETPLYYYIRRKDGAHSVQTDSSLSAAISYYEKFYSIASSVLNALKIPDEFISRASKWPKICEISLNMQRIKLATKHQKMEERSVFIENHYKLIKPLLGNNIYLDNLSDDSDTAILFFTACALDILIYSKDELCNRITPDMERLLEAFKSSSVFLYGAGAVGRTLLHGFLSIHIRPEQVWDQNPDIKEIPHHNIPVSLPNFNDISLEKRKHMFIVIAILDRQTVKDVESYLRANSFTNILRRKDVEFMLRVYITSGR